MDKYILSQLVKELLIEKGQAVLPGFGILSTIPSPASFSEGGRIINPPTKKIVFTENASTEDSLLVERYASKLNEPVESLKRPVAAFIRELASEAVSGGSVELPGLGAVVFSETDGFSFAPDPEKDIFAERDGLESIRLRIVEREEPEVIVLGETSPAPVQEPAPEPEPEKNKEQKPGQKPKVRHELEPADRHHRLFVVIIILLGVIIIAAFLYILGCNGAFDSLLYSEEELELMKSLK